MDKGATDGRRYGKLYEFPGGRKVRTDRPLDGAIAPIASFCCYSCTQKYYGDPPMLIVRYPGAELRFCTDNCALNEGFAAAVEQRWLAEFDGEDFPFVWVDVRYEDLERVADLFDATG